jgi:two-component system, NtrC family, sensor histidine kinase KinB
MVRDHLRGHGTIKGVLFVLVTLAAIALLVHARGLVNDLRLDAQKNVSLRVAQYSLLATYSPQEVLNFTGTIDFPLVYTDENGEPKFWKNLGPELEEDTEENRKKIRQLVHRMDTVHEPIPFQYGNLTDYFHYGDSDLINQVKLFPIVTLIAVFALGLLAYSGFHQIRNAEESGVWVGMARETAHQLGTPISSLMGWIEVLEADPGMPEALEQMRVDTARLEKIAYRFNQIGSSVSLEPTSLEPLLKRNTEYFRARLPRGGRDIELRCQMEDNLPKAELNAFLFEWVIENLLRNSLDSISADGGVITVAARRGKSKRLIVDVTDTGQGMDPAVKEEIFRPGFTTKSRGWGLGLSLARRIVQKVHGGKIFVQEITPGERVCFRIILKEAVDDHA